MFSKSIDKLRIIRNRVLDHTKNSIDNDMKQEKCDFEINISGDSNVYKIEVSDYIAIDDYMKKINSNEKYSILNLICISVLWNSAKQKIDKGIYYVITNDNCIYNILLTDEEIKIDERMRIELDHETKKDNIIQERLITFDINKNEYHYFSAKHDKTGDTFYTKYYSRNRQLSLSVLDLSEEEAYNEINSVISNLENVEEIESLFNIEFLKIGNLKEQIKNHMKKLS